MVGWHHRLNGHEFEQASGDGEGQGSLECCSQWDQEELDMTKQLNNNTFAVKNHPTKKLQAQVASLVKSNEAFNKEIIPILHKFFQTIKGIPPNLLFEASVTLMPKPDKDIARKKVRQRKNHKSTCLMSKDKNHKQKFSKLQQSIQRIMHQDQVGFVTAVES